MNTYAHVFFICIHILHTHCWVNKEITETGRREERPRKRERLTEETRCESVIEKVFLE